MKRINNEWWRGHDGYYKEVSKRVWEGPYDEMTETKDLRIVAIDDVVHLKPSEELMPVDKDDEL